MNVVSTDRWTCPHPDCGETVVASAQEPEDAHAMLRAAQESHGQRHHPARRCSDAEAVDRTAEAMSRLGLDEPGHPGPRRRTPKARRNQAARRS